MADTYTLADLMEEQRTLGGAPALPDVRPREMRTPALGQSNLVDRALSSFGQPSLDALRRGYAGEAQPAEIARTFLETGPMGPFGAVRTPLPRDHLARMRAEIAANPELADTIRASYGLVDDAPRPSMAPATVGETPVSPRHPYTYDPMRGGIAAGSFHDVPASLPPLPQQRAYIPETWGADHSQRMLELAREGQLSATQIAARLNQEFGTNYSRNAVLGRVKRLRDRAPDTKADPPRVPNPIRAYHGSPHDFDEFRLDRIGTGEGAQAYGHGLYFAERPEVARSYRQANEHWATPSTRAGAFLDRAGDDRARAIQLAQQEVDQWRPGTTPHTQATEALEALRSERPLGRMYEVNLHARPEQFLDWDAPLRNQSPEVREALAPLYERAMRRVGPLDARTRSNLSDPSGSTVVTALRNWEGAAPADVSRILREAGIPGTVYDAGQIAGWQGPQSRNYSVFSPEIIEILRKYGIIAPPVGAAAASTLAGEPQP